MAAELQMVISARDAASGVLRGITGPLDGLASAAKAPTSALGGLFNTVASFAVPAIGIAGLIGSLVDMGSAASDAELSSKQLESVLASTKGVAGITADAANDLAASLSRVTKFDDDAIVGGESLLLTFTNIGQDVFPDATEAMLDMSQALGQDMKASAIQLGKALNDPVAGVSALRKVGVSLTDAQEELVAKMVKVGDVAGAQKVILEELSTEFGGAARAAGETFSGKLAILGTQIGNIKEAIGGALTGALSGLVGALIPVVTYIGSVISAGDTMNDFLADVPEFLQPVVKGMGEAVLVIQDVAWAVGRLVSGDTDLRNFADRLGEIFGIDVSPFTSAIATVVDTVKSLLGYLDEGNQIDVMGQWFGPDFGPKIDEAVRAIKGIGQTVGFVFADIQHFLAGDLTLGAFVQNIGIDLKMGGGFFAKFADQVIGIVGKLGTDLVTYIVGQLPAIQAQLLAWGQAFVAWVGPMVPPLLAEAGRLGGQLVAWIAAQASPLTARLLDWVNAFVAWVVPAAVQFLKEWPIQLNHFLDWIGDAAGPILLKLGEWAVAFVAWIVPNIPKVLLALAAVSAAILLFLAETSLTIGLKLAQWGAKFVGFVITDVLPGLPAELAKIGSAAITFINTQGFAIGTKIGEWSAAFLNWVANDVMPSLATKLGSIGSGVTEYIAGGVQAITDKAKTWGSGIISGIVSGVSGLGGSLRDAIWGYLNGISIDLGVFSIKNGAFAVGLPPMPDVAGSIRSYLNGISIDLGIFHLRNGTWSVDVPTIGAPRTSTSTGGTTTLPPPIVPEHTQRRAESTGGVTVNFNNAIILGADRTAVSQLASLLKPELDRIVGYST